MAGALLCERSKAEGIELEILTTGLVGDGQAPPHRAVQVMRGRGIDIEAHRSTLLASRMIDESDLVLGAARAHAWEAVALRPEAVGRIFTLKEFVRLGDELGRPEAGWTLDDWIRGVHRSRRRFDLVHPDEEIEDPYRRSRRVYRRVTNEIETLVDRLSGQLFPILASQSNTIRWYPAAGDSAGDVGSHDDALEKLDITEAE
jgi:protein-tyrosine-phosphatase